MCVLMSCLCASCVGYDHFAGQVLQSSDFETLMDGLKQNNLTSGYSHVLTGQSSVVCVRVCACVCVRACVRARACACVCVLSKQWMRVF